MKVLVVDDDPTVASSLEVLLSRETDMEVTATARDGEHAVRACERQLPDAVLMDLRMPGMGGIEATRLIRARWPRVKVMVLTTFEDEQSIREALQAGASGYLLKSAPAAGMAARLRALMTETAVLDVKVLDRLTDGERAPLPGLTPRENEVAELVAQGCSNREISDALLISEGSARNIISSALEKLGLRDRTQLAIFYWRRTL